MRIGRKTHLEAQISEVERELKAVSREIRVCQRLARRERRLAGSRFPGRGSGKDKSRPGEDSSSRRLASYLSAGSFQTIAHHKFSSDLVRRRRLLIGGAALALIGVVWIIWKAFF
jgi:hypothetical protein